MAADLQPLAHRKRVLAAQVTGRDNLVGASQLIAIVDPRHRPLGRYVSPSMVQWVWSRTSTSTANPGNASSSAPPAVQLKHPPKQPVLSTRRTATKAGRTIGVIPERAQRRGRRSGGESPTLRWCKSPSRSSSAPFARSGSPRRTGASLSRSGGWRLSAFCRSRGRSTKPFWSS